MSLLTRPAAVLWHAIVLINVQPVLIGPIFVIDIFSKSDLK